MPGGKSAFNKALDIAKGPKPIMLCVTSPYETPINKSEGARLWASFNNGGTSHSPSASTLPYLIRRCEREGVPYSLIAFPGYGYGIKPYNKKA